jgi:VWFA-related protein
MPRTGAQSSLRLPIVALLLCVLAGTLALFAQPQQATAPDEVRVSSSPYVPYRATLRVQTNMVEAGVVVRDNAGRPVRDLQQTDFRLFDKGEPQPISFFSVETSEPAGSSAAQDVPHPASGASASPPGGPSPVTQTTRPQYIALFLDDYAMAPPQFAFARRAAEKFIGRGLDPNVRIGIFTTSLTQALDFTNDKSKLLAALHSLAPQTKMSEKGLECGLGPYLAYQASTEHVQPSPAVQAAMGRVAACGLCQDQNSCYDTAIAESESTLIAAESYSTQTLLALRRVIRYLGQMPGRRILMLTSSGFLTATLQAQQDRVVDDALRAGVMINSLDAKLLATEPVGGPLGAPLASTPAEHQITLEQRAGLNDVLATLADATGGEFFHNNNDLSSALSKMALEPELRYVLGFSPEKTETDGQFHALKVELSTTKHFHIQARKGYFAPTKEEASRPTQEEKLDREVTRSESLAELPAIVTSHWLKSSAGSAELSVTVHVDLKPLSFQKQKDREVQQLNFIVALFGPNGNFVAGKQGEIDLALKDDSFARLEASGINGSLDLQAPAGSYRLRTVTQEAVTGKLAASSQPVTLR